MADFDLAKVHIAIFQHTSVDLAGMTAWIVNGRFVRSNVDIDFTEGGNPQAYPDFVPEGEIWIDSSTDTDEWDFILLHEITEYVLMKEKGLKYIDAHQKANEAELKARQAAGQEVNPEAALAGSQENKSADLILYHLALMGSKE